VPDAPPAPRPDLFVVARFLEALWRHQNRIRKTQLQMAARVNYSIFTRYLALLEDRGLVRHTVGPEGDWVELTAKGYEAHRFLAEGLAGLVGPRSAPPGPARA
jgi:predicted transcriptional regulator